MYRIVRLSIPGYMSVTNPQQTDLLSNSQQLKVKPKLNSFGNSVDLTNYIRESHRDESTVDRLLDDETQVQNQLRDLSSESNDNERNLSKTLGEHQMQFLTHLQSIRDAQVY